MSRFGIFVIYARDGVVADSVDYTLSRLSKVVDELVVVANGGVDSKNAESIKGKCKLFVERENSGYDASAYKYVFDMMGEQLETYDEVVLCNDTFYGPFVDFKHIFVHMEDEKCDYWGLNYVNGAILEYIESYFLVFKKRVIESGYLQEFFCQYPEQWISTAVDVCAFFENGIYSFLKRKGLKPGYYTYTDNYNVYRDPDICLIDYSLPIIKKKAFDLKYFDSEKIARAVNYAKDTYRYELFDENYKVLETKQKDTFKEEPITLSEQELLDFIRDNEEIYIYGAGMFARKLFAIYREQLCNLKGFLVSSLDENTPSEVYGISVKCYSNIESSIAIINGLNYKNMLEVIKIIKKGDKFLNFWEVYH